MTDVTHYEFKTFDGWPPDGEPGDFFGFDAGWRPCVLKWFRGKWCGLRPADSDDLFPEAFVRAPDTESYVVRWAPAPMRTTAMPIQGTSADDAETKRPSLSGPAK